MSYTFNIFTGNFDAVDNIAPALLFKGSIDIPGDFPTSALVQNGWFYTITSDVTDDDATKTNTGQSFNALDEIAWNGTNWTIIGNEGIYVPYTGANKSLDMNTHQITSVVDPIAAQDAATKKYVDDENLWEIGFPYGLPQLKNPVQINMQDKQILNLRTAINDADAVNKEYVDDTITDEIATHTALPNAHHDKLHASTHEVGGDDLINHDDLTGFVANEHIDWTNATQDFLTTGDAEMLDLIVNGTFYNKGGSSAIGTMSLLYLPTPLPSGVHALKIFKSLDAAESTGLKMFIQHKPTTQRNGTHAAIGGYNIVEGINFNGSNTVAALSFGNYQYFSGLGWTSITSGSVLTDVLAVDVFGANAVDSAKFLAKDIYGVRAIPVIKATCTDAYGYYYKASTGGTISGTEYGINLEQPTEGVTANKQVYLQGAGNIHSEGDLDIFCPANKTLELQTTVYDDLRTPANAVRLKGASNVPTFAQFEDDAAGSSVGVYTFMFEPTDRNEVFLTVQLPHTYKEGTDLLPHVHWSPQSTNDGDVDWILEYTIANIGNTFGDTATVHMLDTADGTINKHQITTGDVIDGTGMEISHMLVCRLYRDGGEGDDDFTGDAAFLEFDIHYEVNTHGSRQELTK